MVKFSVLQRNQVQMAWMKLSSFDLTKPTNQYFRSFSTYYILVTAILGNVVSSAVFILQNLSNFEIVLDTCIVLIAGFQYGCMFFSVGVNSNTVKALYLKFQKIVDDGKLFDYAWMSRYTIKLIFSQFTKLKLEIYTGTLSKNAKELLKTWNISFF